MRGTNKIKSKPNNRKSKIIVRVPATTANLGPGFDCMGMALDWWNIVEIETIARGLEIEIHGGTDLPRDSSNLTIQAMRAVFRAAKRKMPALRVTIRCKIPTGSGLGSSAAAIVGGVVAANALLKDRFSSDELLKLAAKLEGHPDNVAPALLGGLVVSVQDKKGLVAARLQVPRGLRAVIFVPKRALSTKIARRVLPGRVPLADAIFNASRTALWIAAMQSRHWEWLQVATQDRLHQPYRAKLVPGLQRMFEAANEAGALGAALSGAGPSVIAFTDRDATALRIARAMERVGLAGSARVVQVSNRGAHLT